MRRRQAYAADSCGTIIQQATVMLLTHKMRETESKGSGKTRASSLTVPGTELRNLNDEGRFTPELQSSLMCEAVSITTRHTLYCQGAETLLEIKGVIIVILFFSGGAVNGAKTQAVLCHSLYSECFFVCFFNPFKIF